MSALALVLTVLSLLLAGCSRETVPPQNPGDDAQRVAERITRNPTEVRQLQDELLAWSALVQDKDVLIIYNPGGFGWTSLREDPEWVGLIQGMRGVLASRGYAAAVVEHQRSQDRLASHTREALEGLVAYPAKARVLTAKVDFLTRHYPELTVVVVGSSMGGILTSQVVKKVTAPAQVYGVALGLPFWYRASPGRRVLALNSNGTAPDAFRQGPLALLRANLGHPLSRWERPPGGGIKLFNWYLRAPGHDYRWDQAQVRSQVESFLKKNFQPIGDPARGEGETNHGGKSRPGL